MSVNVNPIYASYETSPSNDPEYTDEITFNVLRELQNVYVRYFEYKSKSRANVIFLSNFPQYTAIVQAIYPNQTFFEKTFNLCYFERLHRVNPIFRALTDRFNEKKILSNIDCPMKITTFKLKKRDKNKVFQGLNMALSLIPTFYIFSGELVFRSKFTTRNATNVQLIGEFFENWHIKI